MQSLRRAALCTMTLPSPERQKCPVRRKGYFLLIVFFDFTTIYIIRQDGEKDNCNYYAALQNNSGGIWEIYIKIMLKRNKGGNLRLTNRGYDGTITHVCMECFVFL